ncbi:MAG TPA: hypothetical protein VKA00_05210 [Trueperaceae bacterium]|nr:hypothetical protein [Trueperaceae bacterium]
MIRNLLPDEVAWFVSRAVAYLGHSDPRGLSQRLALKLEDPVGDAARCFVHARARGEPTAGVYVLAPRPDDGDQTLTLASAWHSGDASELRTLVAEVLDRHPHEAAVAPLHAVPDGRAHELAATLGELGFERDELRRLRFELADVPPLGRPLVVESWSPAGDRAFRALFERAEAGRVSDRYWAYLKRRHGAFKPDLWFMAHEAPDREPVGYALCGTERIDLDARYALNGVGVLQEHRASTEMLRRLVVSTLHELAGVSPFGCVDTELSMRDPKLIDILMSLGFEVVECYAALVRLPR